MAEPLVAFNELSEQLLIGRALVHAANPVALLDRGARVVWSNQAYSRSVEDWLPVKVAGKPAAPPVSAGTSRVCQCLQAAMGQGYRELWHDLSTGSTWSGAVSLAHHGADKSLPDSIYDCILSPLPDAQGRTAYFLLLLHDVTAHHQEKNHHAHVAHHDAMTGLGNRLHLTDAVAGLVDSKQPFALFYLDLDGFKGVNDTFGHAVGDEVLKAFAQHMRDQSRETDLPIRLGGDEFVLLLPGNNTEEQIQQIADRILAQARPVFCKINPLLDGKVGVSIGGARNPMDGLTLDALLHAADTALYHAKRTGKGRFVMKGPEHAAA